MTFLELCQMTRELAGIKGTGPVTVASQSGELLRVVHWVQKSWVDIQNLHKSWNFLICDISFTTTQGKGEYSRAEMGVPTLKAVNRDTMRCNVTGYGTPSLQFMEPWDYSEFRDTFRFVARPQGRPIRFATDPKDKSLWIASIPDAAPDGGGYTITGRGWLRPVVLAADSDVPNIDEDFHMLIVYWALSKYAGFEAASEVKAEAIENMGKLLAALEGSELPEVTLGH